MVADLFAVPTVTFRLLFVLVILAMTVDASFMQTSPPIRPPAGSHSNSATLSWKTTRRRYLVHDRDGAFADVATTVAGMHVEAVLTAPRSPWQNANVERLIGSIRRECLDHVVVVNEAGLRRVLASYVAYYMRSVRILRWRKTARCLAPSNRPRLAES